MCTVESVSYNILFIIVVSVFLVPAAWTAVPRMNSNDIRHVRLYCSDTIIVIVCVIAVCNVRTGLETLK